MALILAIEPDRRQAAQLTRLIQTRVGAELVLADTTEQALGAIGNRVPDLVLVPALLAPQDDATLATALRVIASAAHVQMLTIPVLAPASGARQPLGLGVLARLRRRRAEPLTPDGCDPNVFGDQIAAYLAEAAAQRAIIESDLEIGISTAPTRDAKNTDEFFQDSPDLSVHVLLGGERSLEEPSLAAAGRLIVQKPVVEHATIEPVIETALFTSTTKDTKDTKEAQDFSRERPDLFVHVVLGARADEPPMAAAGRFMVEEPAVERATIAPVLETALFTSTTDLDLRVLGGERAPALNLIATSGEVPAARLDASRPRAVSEAPWFGPQRRWPDLEGQEVVDPLTVSTAADADADVHAAVFPAAVLASVADLPILLAVMDESAAAVGGEIREELPIDVQEASPAIDLVSLEEPAVLELWMPLSFGSSRSWPMLEGVWSEARPDPPELVQAAAPAVAAAPPVPSLAEARVPPPDAAATRPEWIELIESLRQDVKRLRSERTQVPIAASRTGEIPTPGSRPSPPPRRAAVAEVDLSSKKRAQPAKPAQDEWGFFDPEQCGFAALLAKLDEITQVTDGA